MGAGSCLPLSEAVAEALTIPSDAPDAKPDRHGLTAAGIRGTRSPVDGPHQPGDRRQVYISRRTVTTHVTNILAKFGVGNRVEAVDYAHRHGLIGHDASPLYVTDVRPTTGRRSSPAYASIKSDTWTMRALAPRADCAQTGHPRRVGLQAAKASRPGRGGPP